MLKRTSAVRQRELGLLELEVVVQRAVVGAAGAAEDHVLLVGAEVVREAEARLERVLERLAIVAGADVVVDVERGVRIGAGRQRLPVGDARSDRIDFRIERVEHELRRLEVEIGRILLDVPAHAEIQREVIVDRPVVLDEQPELLVTSEVTVRIETCERQREHGLPRNGGGAGRRDVVIEHRAIAGHGVRGGQIDLLVLDAGLDRVVAAEPGDVGEGDGVADRPALLTLVLAGARVGAIDREDVVVLAVDPGVDRAIHVGGR